ncbi:hypothetical protein TorRG33x02_221470, partial [Trema orientale]
MDTSAGARGPPGSGKSDKRPPPPHLHRTSTPPQPPPATTKPRERSIPSPAKEKTRPTPPRRCPPKRRRGGRANRWPEPPVRSPWWFRGGRVRSVSRNASQAGQTILRKCAAF